MPTGDVPTSVGQEEKKPPVGADPKFRPGARSCGGRYQSNALVLMADPAQVRTPENIVHQLDQPRSQVLIHAAIVEISGDIVEAPAWQCWA